MAATTTTIGLRSLSLTTLSALPLLRNGKIKPPTHSYQITRITLKPLISTYNPATLRGTFPSFCTSPNTSVDAPAPATNTATSPPHTAETEATEADIRDAANLLDIRVGRIIKAWRHEEADSLYVEEVDVGEPEPRIICSGLVKYVALEMLQDAKVVVLANLKPRNMRGVKSFGMLMAASDAVHENVELLMPPDDAVPGERIWFGNEGDKENQSEPATANQVQKKKIWESVQPHLKTDYSCTAMLGEHLMRTSSGVVVSKSLKNANIS